jgi:hypothetical protein
MLRGMKRTASGMLRWLREVLGARRSGAELAEATSPAAPSPGRVPPNASHIEATVVAECVWREQNADLLLVDSLVVRIHSSKPVMPTLACLAAPDTVLDALASDAVTTGLQGKRIAASVMMTVDSGGTRWWISNVRLAA